MLSLALHWQILIALVAGTSAGFFFGGQVSLFSFLGTFFLNALKMIIVPLIATSIITGVAGVGKAGNLGSMGIRTFAYYMSPSLLAILIGLVLVNFIQPGKGAELGFKESPQKLQESLDKFGDSPLEALQRLLLDMIPTPRWPTEKSCSLLYSRFYLVFLPRASPRPIASILCVFSKRHSKP